ncbi:MAG: hypothetical protein ACLTYN_05010 [Dysosmobacter welbionis]
MSVNSGGIVDPAIIGAAAKSTATSAGAQYGRGWWTGSSASSPGRPGGHRHRRCWSGPPGGHITRWGDRVEPIDTDGVKQGFDLEMLTPWHHGERAHHRQRRRRGDGRSAQLTHPGIDAGWRRPSSTPAGGYQGAEALSRAQGVEMI